MTSERLSIKDWAEEDRPREKMLLKGVPTLSDTELLGILLSSGNQKETAVQLAQRILNSVSNNLNELGKMSLKELMTFRGVGQAKAVTIAAALELGRRRGATEPLQKPEIKSSYNCFQLFSPILSDLPYEELWVVYLTNSGKVLEKQKISRGGTGVTAVDVKLIMKGALETLSSGLLICHNHPSGNKFPSRQDDVLTAQVSEAAKLFDIQLLDHLIICDQTYYSYADEKRILTKKPQKYGE